MPEHNTLMQARRVRKLHSAGWTMQDIADLLGVHRNSVWNMVHGHKMQQQQAKADRAEALCGGVLGPGQGNYRTQVVERDGEQIERIHWEMGHHELTAPDPLDILIAEENLNDRLKDTSAE